MFSLLESDDLLPAIIFRTARHQCDTDVERLGSDRKMSAPPEKQKEVQDAVYKFCEKTGFDASIILDHAQLQPLIKAQVGAHHAGQLLVWRLLLEELMCAGLIRGLFATGTVAAGVDFPARSVVVTAHSRRGATGYEVLKPSEFQQMSGRAGRRGKDSVGFCFVAPSKFCDARTVLRIARSKPEPLQSAYFPSPSTVLNLLRYRNVDDLRFTVSKTLASYVDKEKAEVLLQEAEEKDKDESGSPKVRKRVNRLRRQADELRDNQKNLLESSLSGLRKLGYLDGFSLSEKGYFAANICTNLVLELAEFVQSGFLDNRTPRQLAAIMASICGDEHRKFLEGKPDGVTSKEVKEISSLIKPVRQAGIPGVKEGSFVSETGAYTVESWFDVESWDKFRGYLTLVGVTEGDVARLVSQSAEQLQQITRLSESHPELALKAEQARRVLLRPPLLDIT